MHDISHTHVLALSQQSWEPIGILECKILHENDHRALLEDGHDRSLGLTAESKGILECKIRNENDHRASSVNSISPSEQIPRINGTGASTSVIAKSVGTTEM
jgi:hypothetical protein